MMSETAVQASPEMRLPKIPSRLQEKAFCRSAKKTFRHLKDEGLKQAKRGDEVIEALQRLHLAYDSSVRSKDRKVAFELHTFIQRSPKY